MLRLRSDLVELCLAGAEGRLNEKSSDWDERPALGVVLAAFVLTVAPELLRSFAEYRVLLFGVLMVAMMIWRPRGLVRISRASFAERKGVAP